MRSPQTHGSPAPAIAAAPDFLVVDEHVVRNPVARAVARTKLKRAVLDFQLRLYNLLPGTNVQADAQAAARVLAVALRVLDNADQGSTPDARVMAGGMGCLSALAQRRWAWHTQDAVAVDQALHRALPVYMAASAVQLQAAHRYVTHLEATANNPEGETL